jgi:hypothetical protein
MIRAFCLMFQAEGKQQVNQSTGSNIMKRQILMSFAGAAAVALLGLGVSTAQADQKVSVGFQMPVHVTSVVNATGCRNSPGPTVTLEGEIALGGLQAQLIFQNNVKGTHRTEVTVGPNVVLVPLGSKITIPKQPVLGGVGGNPHIWIQFYDAQGNIGDEIYLGRCVQGLKLQNNFLNNALLASIIAASGCQNSPGPYITIGGDLAISGLNARFIFRNNLKGTHTAEATASVNILPDGALVKIPKQPVLGGSGGNPLIWVQFLQGNGDPIGDPVFLGRCNKL